jgi:hypothetical protein
MTPFQNPGTAHVRANAAPEVELAISVENDATYNWRSNEWIFLKPA